MSVMYTQLKERLWAFIVDNNPDVMLSLRGEYSVAIYLNEKVKGVMPQAKQLLREGKELSEVESRCFEAMTSDLKPSKFLYLKSLMHAEFNSDFMRFAESGVLTYELINMVEACKLTFLQFGTTTENIQSPALRRAICNQIREYLYPQSS